MTAYIYGHVDTLDEIYENVVDYVLDFSYGDRIASSPHLEDVHGLIEQVVDASPGAIVGWSEPVVTEGTMGDYEVVIPETFFGWEPGAGVLVSSAGRSTPEVPSSRTPRVVDPIHNAAVMIRISRLAWRIAQGDEDDRRPMYWMAPFSLSRYGPWFLRHSASRSLAVEGIRAADTVDAALRAVMSAHPDPTVFQYGLTHLMEMDPSGVAAAALCVAWGTM
jgi:hypothetical protein